MIPSRLLSFFALFFLAGGCAVAGPAEPSVLEPAARLQLVRSAAQRAGLHEVGLDFRDVYGVIHAESSWVPRTGMGKNGVASVGLGQFEPATARAVGLRDPNNAADAVNAAARLLREAAAWSAQRVARLGLTPEQRAAKLREGVSIYYNLSSQARSAWNGLNTDRLPVETQRHIRNVREGAAQADRLNARLGGPDMPPLPAVSTVQAKAAAVAPQIIGTIEWSGKGEGAASGRRTYAVLSDGTVKPQAAHNGGIQWTRRGG
jgi:hypothetical protein